MGKKTTRTTTGQGAVRAGRGFTLLISNEDMDDIIKIVESLKKSGLLTDSATKTEIKHEIKNRKVDFSLLYDHSYGCFIDSTNGFLINTTYSFFINKFYCGFLPLLALQKVLGKGVRRAVRGDMNKHF